MASVVEMEDVTNGGTETLNAVSIKKWRPENYDMPVM